MVTEAQPTGYKHTGNRMGPGLARRVTVLVLVYTRLTKDPQPATPTKTQDITTLAHLEHIYTANSSYSYGLVI